MNNKPLIGIVGRPSVSTVDWGYINISEDIRRLVIRNGGLSIGIIPTALEVDFDKNDMEDETQLTFQEKKDLLKIVKNCQGIIIQGGLSSAGYEVQVAKLAIKDKIPLLGICAGFNNIIEAFGGSVYKLKNNKVHNKFGKKYAHFVEIRNNSLLFSLLEKEKIRVNSIHTIVADESDIKGLNVSAVSDDGLVEAVESISDNFILGIKWHPEIMTSYSPIMNNIFERFVKECKN